MTFLIECVRFFECEMLDKRLQQRYEYFENFNIFSRTREELMIRLGPDNETKVAKIKVGNVPVLIVRSKVKEKVPVAVLWIHGGGYMLGMKEMVYFTRALDLVKEFGVTVISPGYTLSWNKPYPAAFNDCYTVLEYLDKNKEAFGFKRIMIGGESAGGGLCAALVLKARDNGIHISYQMPLYPMLDNFDTESSKDNHGKVWNTRKNHLGWKLYLRKDYDKEVSPYASPSRETDYSNLPPCYTFVGDMEPFYKETVDYVKSLKDAGVDATLDIYHTNVHAFDLLSHDEELKKEAKKNFLKNFKFALDNYKLG